MFYLHRLSLPLALCSGMSPVIPFVFGCVPIERFIAYDAPQVIVRFHDGYSGELLYSEGISTLDALPPGPPVEKKHRFGHWHE